ncbi:hypothetical protein SC499_22475 [Peribacillus simplex]|uniref:hypothetical protein n=1 Tax=Peribacillus simplex TaxID=1478 RepID=UPI00298DDD80|nr:hypothetical protein [Peribacillus simplex]MDW7617370.1 hypothetical protein [Peribacillus simplex]
MSEDGKYARLNVEVGKDLKKRTKNYCTDQEMTLKDFVALALESTLDELEGETV